MRYRLSEYLLPLKQEETFFDTDIRVELMTKDEFTELSEQLAHKKVLLHLLEHVRYCKAEMFGNCAIGSIVIPEVKKVSSEKAKLGFYMTDRRLIFIEGDNGYARWQLGRLKETHYGKNCSPAIFFADFLNSMIEDDSVELQEYEEKMIDMESRMLKKTQSDSNEEILRYRKDMLRLHSYYAQLEDMGDVLRSNLNHLFSEGELELFSIFSHHVSRLNSHVEMLREYIVQIHDTYRAQLDLAQNHVMNLLTVVTTIFLPLTLIAGWYGMNFTHMPELAWNYGYLWVIGLSVAIVVIEIYIFRKKHLL